MFRPTAVQLNCKTQEWRKSQKSVTLHPSSYDVQLHTNFSSLLNKKTVRRGYTQSYTHKLPVFKKRNSYGKVAHHCKSSELCNLSWVENLWERDHLTFIKVSLSHYFPPHQICKTASLLPPPSTRATHQLDTCPRKKDQAFSLHLKAVASYSCFSFERKFGQS